MCARLGAVTGSTAVGREAFARRAWREAFDALSDADRRDPLGLDDLERLATAAYLVGRDDAELWARTFHACTHLGDASRAARCAFVLCFGLFSRGEGAQAAGWLARAQKALADAAADGPGQGYVLVFAGLEQLESGEPEMALASFEQVAACGERFGDRDLATLGALGHGQSLVALGRTAEGAADLDEAIVAISADEVSPVVTGIVYCAAIETCQLAFDLRRAQEWTTALDRWCDAQPDLVPFRGQCLVHRSQILQLHGAWNDASDEAQRAFELLAGGPAAGLALYQQGELHRVQGQRDAAERAYRDAHRAGREPQPGLALLRLAQGRVDAALGAIRRVVGEARGAVARAAVLGPDVEIRLAAGDVAGARASADELSAIALDLGATLVQAAAAQATGAVLLAEGEAGSALDTLRRAWAGWHGLDAPYEAARVRVLVGLACRALGDEEGAAMELDAARWVFDQLGAVPDLARVTDLARPTPGSPPAPLTAREAEVVRLVARGRTNREIAAELFISDRTVARHLSNIFAKLGLSSRAAATAWAYEHGLAGTSA
jgi:DNA-binding CsgD family transcriptional regulator